jgi:hypothetical protein
MNKEKTADKKMKRMRNNHTATGIGKRKPSNIEEQAAKLRYDYVLVFIFLLQD